MSNVISLDERRKANPFPFIPDSVVDAFKLAANPTGLFESTMIDAFRVPLKELERTVATHEHFHAALMQIYRYAIETRRELGLA